MKKYCDGAFCNSELQCTFLPGAAYVYILGWYRSKLHDIVDTDLKNEGARMQRYSNIIVLPQSKRLAR